jgi:hypothetical protein
MPAFAMADPAYDALIIQARNGNFTPRSRNCASCPPNARPRARSAITW